MMLPACILSSYPAVDTSDAADFFLMSPPHDSADNFLLTPSYLVRRLIHRHPKSHCRLFPLSHTQE